MDGWRLGRIFLQPTTQTRPTTTSRISELSRMPVSGLLSPTSYVKRPCRGKTLLDSASAVVQCSGVNSTENPRKQKQRDKRTWIKNMTEMCNNFPARDYMKQLATIIGMD